LADKKITQLNNITGADLADADEFVVVDITSDETKAITFNELKTAFDTGTGFVRITGDTMTGDLSFGDNDKAIFGAGSDLQIYHDGPSSHSIIAESGGGSLFIRGQGITLQNADGSKAYFGGIGDVATAYYGTSAKLATTSTGVDVTGTVTADGLTVGSATGVFPSEAIQVRGNDGTSGYINGLGLGDANDQFRIFADDTNNTGGSIKFDIRNRDRLLIEDNGNISFYEDTGTTAKFFWDASAEILDLSTGLTVGSPSNPTSSKAIVKVADSASAIQAFEVTNRVNADFVFKVESNLVTGGSTIAKPIAFMTSNTERMRIDSSGNVGIGESSPLGKLHIKGSDTGATASAQGNSLVLEDSENGLSILSSTAGAGYINFGDSSDNNVGMIVYDHSANVLKTHVNGSEAMRIDSSGALLLNPNNSTRGLKITTTQGEALGSDTTFDTIGAGYGKHIFKTDGTEAMRIESSGNVLIGTTSAYGTTGTTINQAGLVYSSANSDRAGQFDLTGNDGEIVRFTKAGATVGSIGTSLRDSQTNFYIAFDQASSDVGLGFGHASGTGRAYYPSRVDGSGVTGAISIGTSDYKYKDLYLSGGVYLGGTGSANKLDDYEESNFTATLRGSTAEPATLITVTGFATKIGRVVQYSIGFENDNTTGYTGSLTITGLPFANNGGRAIGNIVGYVGLTFTGTQSFSVLGNGTTILEAFNISSASAWNNSTHNAGTNRYFWLTGTYMTTA
tara:strand:- start:97 stop:2301 length:2205 start_codon:yes stop_codon:yes gene_type:complete